METFRQNFNIVLAELVVCMPEKSKKNKEYLAGKYLESRKVYTSVITKQNLIQWMADAGIKLPSNPVEQERLLSEIFSNIHPRCNISGQGWDAKYMYNKCSIPTKLKLEKGNDYDKSREKKILFERDFTQEEREKYFPYIKRYWYMDMKLFCEVPSCKLWSIGCADIPFEIQKAKNENNANWNRYTLFTGFKEQNVKGATNKDCKLNVFNSCLTENPLSVIEMKCWLKMNKWKPKAKYEDLKQQVIEMCKVI